MYTFSHRMNIRTLSQLHEAYSNACITTSVHYIFVNQYIVYNLKQHPGYTRYTEWATGIKPNIDRFFLRLIRIENYR